MAITRVWQSGFEHAEMNDSVFNYEFDSKESHGAVTVTTPAGGVGGAVKLKMEGYNNGRTFFIHTGGLTQYRSGFHFFWDYKADGATFKIWEAKTLAGSRQYQLVVNGNTHQLLLYKGSALVQATTGLCPAGSWHHVGVDVLQSATVGWCDVWLNGINVLAWGLGNNGAVSAEAIGIGQSPKMDGDANILEYDNFYIDNMSGEARGAGLPIYYYKRLLPITPDATYNNWDGSDGNKVNNYALVDEIPPNEDTDYVSAAAAGVIDSYTLEAYTPTVGTSIASVIPTAIARKTSSAQVQLKLGTRLAATDLMGAAQDVPATSYSSRFKFERQTTKPGGGAWAAADLATTEIEIESAGSYA